MKRALAAAILSAASLPARADGGPLRFPGSFADGVLYATVERGSLREDIYTSRAAIAAVKAGRPIPDGTVITLVDMRDGKLFRYVVMEKRAGSGDAFPPEQRTGDWRFQWFNTDRSVKTDENVGCCMACHKPQAHQDFVFTRERMKSAN